MPAIGRTAFRRFGFVQSSVVTRWPEIVGPAPCPASARPNRSVFRPARRATASSNWWSFAGARADHPARDPRNHGAGEPFLRLSRRGAREDCGKAWFKRRQSEEAPRTAPPSLKADPY
jgi:hypothetical protein